MPLLTCPHCGQLTLSERWHCLRCDARLPENFGILLQPNPKADMDTMLRTTLLREGTQAAIRQWLEVNPNGDLAKAETHIKRLRAVLSPQPASPGV